VARPCSKIPQLDGPIPDPYDDVLSTPNVSMVLQFVRPYANKYFAFLVFFFPSLVYRYVCIWHAYQLLAALVYFHLISVTDILAWCLVSWVKPYVWGIFTEMPVEADLVIWLRTCLPCVFLEILHFSFALKVDRLIDHSHVGSLSKCGWVGCHLFIFMWKLHLCVSSISHWSVSY
jgi:hypothetical protein